MTLINIYYFPNQFKIYVYVVEKKFPYFQFSHEIFIQFSLHSILFEIFFFCRIWKALRCIKHSCFKIKCKQKMRKMVEIEKVSTFVRKTRHTNSNNNNNNGKKFIYIFNQYLPRFSNQIFEQSICNTTINKTFFY